MKPSTQALLIVAGLWALASIGNAHRADELLGLHLKAITRWGALHPHPTRLRGTWRAARRDARICTVWAVAMIAVAAAVEFW